MDDIEKLNSFISSDTNKNDQEKSTLDDYDIKYSYTGLVDKKRPLRPLDNLLHIAARNGNIKIILSTYQRSFAENVNLLRYNDERDSPFHILAKNGILRDVVKEIVSSLKSSKDEEISSLKKQIKSCKEKLSCNDIQEGISKFKNQITDVEKKYEYHLRSLRDTIRSPDQHKKTPLHWIINTYERREIKETLGLNSLISNKNIRTSLLIVGAAVTIATMCVALYLLYATAPALALASAFSLSSAGATFFVMKIPSELIDLSTESLSSDLVQSNA
ncbi:MAG: hypothetical protein KTV77_02670 [Wolbachia endosymbiont of Fragariocoptes setiger]|nr:hypothetical protein [Wolbachia endosymbiont of Fragariocoptes setiger]